MIISYSFGIVNELDDKYIDFLKRSSEGCDLYFFGLLTDDAISSWFTSTIHPYQRRYNLLANIISVSEVMSQNSYNPLENLMIIKKRYPDAVINLYHSGKWDSSLVEKYLNRMGGKVVNDEFKETINGEDVDTLMMDKCFALNYLQDKLEKSKIIKNTSFFVSDYQKLGDKVIALIKQKFSSPITIRSVLSDEDSFDNRRRLKSVDIENPKDEEALKQGIDRIVEQYLSKEKDVTFERILISAQTVNPRCSGTIFTQEGDQNRPYYLIRYRDFVLPKPTKKGSPVEIYLSHNSNLKDIPVEAQKLVDVTKEITDLLDLKTLSIRYTIDRDDKIYIHLVQPISAKRLNRSKVNKDDFNALEKETIKQYKENNPEGKILIRSGLVNPYDYIAYDAQELEMSLFNKFIYKSSFVSVRKEFGFKEITEPKLYRLNNHVYTALEDSLYLSLPAEMSDEDGDIITSAVKQKFLNEEYFSHLEYYMPRYFHFTARENFTKLYPEIEKENRDKLIVGLRNISAKMISEYDYKKDEESVLASLELIKNQYAKIKETPSRIHQVQQMRKLIAEAKDNIVKPYIKHHEYALQAILLLNSLAERGEKLFVTKVINYSLEGEYNIARDLRSVLTNENKPSYFNDKYGDVRILPFDINSKTYRDFHFAKLDDEEMEGGFVAPEEKPFRLTTKSEERLAEIIRNYDFPVEKEKFFFFISHALREYGRFYTHFMSAINIVLNVLESVTNALGFTKDDIKYTNLVDFYASTRYDNDRYLIQSWRYIIDGRKNIEAKQNLLELNDVIASINDFYNIKNVQYIDETSVNRLTRYQNIRAVNFANKANLNDRTVLLTSNNMGAVFTLAYDIKGVVSQLGSYTSDLYIATYLNRIPTSLGVGDVAYNNFKK